MATLSDLLVQQAGKRAGDSSFTAGQQGVANAVQLASVGQQLENQKQQQQIQKTQLATQQSNLMNRALLDPLSRTTDVTARTRILKRARPVLERAGIPISDASSDELIHDKSVQQGISRLQKSGALGALGQSPEAQTAAFATLANELGMKDALQFALDALDRGEKRETQIEARELRAGEKATTVRRASADKLFQQFERSKKIDRLNKALEAGQNATRLLGLNNPVADEASKTQLARVAGEVGNLTEQDIARFGGSRALAARATQLAKTLQTGTLTAANRTLLQEISGVFERSQRDAFDVEVNRFVNSFTKRNPEVSRGDAFEILGLEAPPTLLVDQQVTAPEGAPQPVAAETETLFKKNFSQIQQRAQQAVSQGQDPAAVISQLEGGLGRALNTQERQQLFLGQAPAGQQAGIGPQQVIEDINRRLSAGEEVGDLNAVANTLLDRDFTSQEIDQIIGK